MADDKKEKADKAPVKKKAKKFATYKKLRSCPKCGPGIRLAEHKDRYACGKCGYTQFKK